MIVKSNRKLSTIFKRALEIMNDGGKHWIKGDLCKRLPDGTYGYCALGAIRKVTQKDLMNRYAAERILANCLTYSVAGWNDRSSTFFSDIKRVFKEVINRELDKEKNDIS